MSHYRPSLLAALLVGTALSLVPAAQRPAYAQAAGQQFSLSIPAQPLPQALAAFSTRTGVQVFYSSEAAYGLRSNAVNGTYSADQALSQMLAGTGASARRVGQNGITISVAGEAAASTGNVASNGTIMLDTITIQAGGNATEGTASYATDLPTPTATPLGLTLKETPQSVSVITRKRIEDQSLTDTRSALQQTPGVFVNDMGPERYSVMSRGYSMDTYQFDGVNTSFEISSNLVHQTQGDLIIYDRVEVLRGATGLMTGAGYPSGAVNLVRKKPTDTFQGYISGGVGSWERYRGEFDVSGPLNKAGTVRGRLVGAVEDGNSFMDYYKTGKQVLYGVIEADLTDTTKVTAGIDYQRKRSDGNYWMGFPLFFTDGTQVNPSRAFNAGSRYNYHNTDTYNSFIRLDQELSNDWNASIAINHSYTDGDMRNIGPDSWSGAIDKATGEGLLYHDAVEGLQRQISVDAKIDGKYQLFDREHDVAIGFSYGDYKTESNILNELSGISSGSFNLYDWDGSVDGVYSGHLADNDWHVRQIGGYAATRIRPTDDLSLIAGIRVSNYKNQFELVNPGANYYSSTLAEHDGIVTPYLGVVYDVNDIHTVYASYTTIFRPQTYRDRYGNFLDPLKGENYELGVKSSYLSGGLNTSISLYQINQDNLAQSDSGYRVPGTNNTAYKAVEGAVTRGVDLEINGEISHGWNVAASYSYSRTENADGERIRTTFPQHFVKLWTSYSMPGDWENLTVGAGLTWSSGISLTTQPWWASNELSARQGSYAVVDLMARYDFNEKVSAALKVNNVFDRKYLTSMDSTFYTGYYGAPRNVTFDLKYSF